MGETFQPSGMVGYTLPVYEYRRPPELGRKDIACYPVIVVGAGLAGLSAALELGSRGIRCLILDDDDTVGACGLSSRGIYSARRLVDFFGLFGAAARLA